MNKKEIIEKMIAANCTKDQVESVVGCKIYVSELRQLNITFGNNRTDSTIKIWNSEVDKFLEKKVNA